MDEVVALRVEVQAVLARDLKTVRARLASAETALVAALVGDIDPGTAHLIAHRYYEPSESAMAERTPRPRNP